MGEEYEGGGCSFTGPELTNVSGAALLIRWTMKANLDNGLERRIKVDLSPLTLLPGYIRARYYRQGEA